MANRTSNTKNMLKDPDVTPSKPQQNNRASLSKSKAEKQARSSQQSLQSHETTISQHPIFVPRYASSASDDDTESDPDSGFASEPEAQRHAVSQHRPSSRSTQSRNTNNTVIKSPSRRVVDSEDEGDSNLPLTNTNLGLIRSDEIDGPTDFTENIEYWMKLKRPTKTVPGRLEEEVDDDKLRSELEEWVGSDQMDDVSVNVKQSGGSDEKVGERVDEETNTKGAQGHDEKYHEAVIIEQRDTTIRALETQLARLKREHEASSISVLAQNQKLEKQLAESKKSSDGLRGEIELLKKDNGNILSQRQVAHLAEVEDLAKGHKAELAELKLRHQAELQDAQQQQRHRSSSSQKGLGDNWSSTVERESEIKKLRTELAVKNGRIEELERERLEKVDSLESQLRTKETLIKSLETRLEEQNRKNRGLEGDLERSREMHAELQVQLDNAEHEARITREGFEDEQREGAKSEKKLKDALEKAEKKVAEVERLKNEIKELEMEHEEDLERVKNEMEEEIKRMRSKAEVAVKKVGELLDKERKEIQRLKAEAAEKSESEGDLRNELLLVNDQIEDMSKERDSFKSKLEKVVTALEKEQESNRKNKSELIELRNELALVSEALNEEKLVNVEAEKRMTEVVAEREKEWKRRLSELRTEMELRSKLLMIEWGRKEVGDKENMVPRGVVQGYKYQFKDGEFIQE